MPPSGQVHGAAILSCREKAVESSEQSASLSERIKDSGGGVGALSRAAWSGGRSLHQASGELELGVKKTGKQEKAHRLPPCVEKGSGKGTIWRGAKSGLSQRS